MEEKKKKLSLNELKVQSFVTELDGRKADTNFLIGGDYDSTKSGTCGETCGATCTDPTTFSCYNNL